MEPNGNLRWLPDGGGRPPREDDWKREDWEIQEPTVTITRTQLADAVLSMCGEWKDNRFISLTADPVGYLAKKLGLEDPSK